MRGFSSTNLVPPWPGEPKMRVPRDCPSHATVGFHSVGFARGSGGIGGTARFRAVSRAARPVGVCDGRRQVPGCFGSGRAGFGAARADPVARRRRCGPKTVRPRGGGPLPEALRQARGAAAAAVLVRLLSKTSGAAAAPLDGAPPSSVESSPGAGAAAPLRRAALSCSGAARGEELGSFSRFLECSGFKESSRLRWLPEPRFC